MGDGRGQVGRRLGDSAGFWTTWSAFTVSAFGSYVTTLAVGVLVVLTLDGGATEVGLVNAAKWLPYLLFGLVAGVLVDRVRPRPLLIAADFGRGLLLLAVPLLATFDRLHIGWLIALMGRLRPAVADPRRGVPGASAAARAHRSSDACLRQARPERRGGTGIGSGAGRRPVSLVGAPLAVLVDAVSLLVSGLLLCRVSVPEPPGRSVSVRGVSGEVAAGLRWVYRHATLAALVLNTHVGSGPPIGRSRRWWT